MEPISARGIVMGLVGSLGNTLQVLEDFASRFTSEKFGSDFKDAHVAISKSRSDLARIQGNIPITWMQSQPDELLDVLKDTGQRLERLWNSIQHAEKFRTKLFLGWQSRAPLKYDIDVAKSSIDLALQMLNMIGGVQGRIQETEPFIEESRWNSRGMIARTQYLASVWQRSHAPLLLTAPDTKVQQIFAWMAIPEEQDSFHQQCRAERVAGTCDWFLETKEYETWREQPVSTGDEGILWCQGKPGIGKTVLASRVIDRLRTSYNVAYFYMSSGGRLHSATDVATSLLRQLCLPFHIVPERLKQLYEQSGREPNAPLELEDMLQALIEASRGIDQPVMIVVDALDECNMREQKEFVKVLASLKETSWKSLVTSRSDQDILSRAYGGCYQFSIEDDNVESDIRNFVDSAIRGNEPVDTMLRDRDLRLEVTETLISRAHGMFYWVSLQLRRVLDQTSISGIRQALATIPNDVGGIVKSALDMIKIQHSGRVQLATRTLALLTAAKAPTTAVVPMTAGAMSHAIGIAHVLDSEDRLLSLREDEIPNAESIAECCMGLVAIDPVTRVVTLAHFDIAQYMQTHWDELFSWKEKLMLANITLAYLSLNVFSTGPCHQADALSKRLEAYPFLDYASRYWGHHAREAISLQDADTESGRLKLIAEVDWLLKNRMNLESSLQVCDLNAKPSRVREALLRSNGKDFALHAKKFGSVSELQVATRHGLFIIARSIIDSHPDQVTYQDDFGTSALHEAAQGGWADIVDLLLKAGAPSSLMNEEEKPPLYYAAQNGNTEIISIISEAKHTNEIHPERSDPAIPPSEQMQRSGRIETAPLNEDQGNPLALEEPFCDAAGAGSLEVIRRLLGEKANPDSKKDGKPAIIYAIQGGHESILKLLLNYGAHISVVDHTPSGFIPLHQAIKSSDNDIAQILLDYGADIETRDDLGRTALFETLDHQSLDGACLLLAQGISISSGDFQRNTVLHEAAQRGAVEHASLFIDQGIGLDEVNEEGVTPLHLATRNGHYRIVNMLLKKGAKVESLDKLGWTPLMYAALAGSAQICQILLSYGANVATPSNDHKTSCMLAAQKGHDQIIRLLHEHGADVNAVEEASKPPLSLAADAGHAQVVRLLIDFGADIDALDKDSRTALVQAADAGHAQVVRLLLEHGADINALDKDSRTALVQAVDNGHASIVQLLLEHGADPYMSEMELRKLSRRTTKTSSKLIRQLSRDYGFRFDSD